MYLENQLFYFYYSKIKLAATVNLQRTFCVTHPMLSAFFYTLDHLIFKNDHWQVLLLSNTPPFIDVKMKQEKYSIDAEVLR